MSESSISYLKNHLPELVHQAEMGKDIKITRHGKPVAVIVSLNRYENNYKNEKGVFSAYLKWRALNPKSSGFSDQELEAMRDRAPHTENTFNWE